MFESLRAKLEAAIAAATPAADPRQVVGQMREALIEMRAGVGALREAMEQAERKLAAAQAELVTAERRRAMAAEIQDAETVAVADLYIARHRERTGALERKVAAQRAELTLAEQDLVEMTAQFTEAAKQRGVASAGQSADAAWADLGAAGVDRPEVDPEQELLRHRMDRRAIEAAADAKLEELKRRMGKQ